MNIFKSFLSYWEETKKLNKLYYQGLEENDLQKSDPKTQAKELKAENGKRISILLNSRIYEESLEKDVWKRFNSIIEEKMTYFPFLPYQICDCFYIGEQTAWTGYNWNNKRTLQIGINKLNYLLEDAKNLDEAVCKIIPENYHIRFEHICFDGPYSYGLPRSYILYRPETKAKKISQYPLIAFFNTIGNDPSEHNGENYIGELYYAINGDLSKAVLHCFKKDKFVEFIFSVVGETFLISKIRTVGKNGKLFTLYDCTWKFTDYINFQ